MAAIALACGADSVLKSLPTEVSLLAWKSDGSVHGAKDTTAVERRSVIVGL